MYIIRVLQVCFFMFFFDFEFVWVSEKDFLQFLLVVLYVFGGVDVEKDDYKIKEK